jgi:subtilisin family serine protease
MEANFLKLDFGLQEVYANYLDLANRKKDKHVWVHRTLRGGVSEVHLTITYKGSISNLENLNIKEIYVEREGVANGMVQLADIALISNNDNIIKLTYGKQFEVCLDNSAKSIKARANTLNVDGVWTVNQTTGIFSGQTGEGVIIGIIDSGIDYKHGTFFVPNTNETRILSIWDQGLIRTGTEVSPPINMLSTGPSYGVMYTKAQIDAELASPANPSTIRHRDCGGHGTHVTGTAAGNGRRPALVGRSEYEYTGVAPKADIVFVKYMDLENDPPVNNIKRFKDAITYILKFAELNGNKPVVINCSFGSRLGPHDGLDEGDEQTAPTITDGRHIFLNNTFAAAVGKICVFSAGNYAGSDRHAKITIPVGGVIEVNVEMVDRSTMREDYIGCRRQNIIEEATLEIWYKNDISNVRASFKPMNEAAFGSAVVLDGPPLNNQAFDTHKRYSISHTSNKASRLGTDVIRNCIRITTTPHREQHLEGIYTIKIEGPANAELQIWTGRTSYGYKVNASAGVVITKANTIGDPSCNPNVISVAAYNDTNNLNRITSFSSRGPLMDYSGSGVLTDKPTIAAPGFDIFSSRSYDAVVGIREVQDFILQNDLCFHYRNMDGTSMAAPHIAGVVALMLQKNANQTLADIKNNFRANATPLVSNITNVADDSALTGTEPTATPEERGKGRIDVLETLNNIIP